ncbi:hypothetical protein WR25_04990 [Diploscapter pachys]|uniref:Uncharacterized protein n=1 Tax=Diploscapter pachys TaxID=2018661 RepID=A0A2A2J4Z3_9BILA|nr:hypothetical protein WR25_04990 [Diploscapter pachys]
MVRVAKNGTISKCTNNLGTPSYFFSDKSYLEIFLIFWIPNGVWVVFPFVVMVVLWNQLARLPDTKHDENDNQYIVCNSNAI